jgi:hypothetical protein
MFIKCWQNVMKLLTKRSENVDKTVKNGNGQKRSENVDKTVRNVYKTLRNVHKTLTKRSETSTKRSETFTKRWQNAQKRSQDVLKTFTTHSENIDQSVLSVTAFISTWNDGRHGTLVSPLCTCVLNGLLLLWYSSRLFYCRHTHKSNLTHPCSTTLQRLIQ